MLKFILQSLEILYCQHNRLLHSSIFWVSEREKKKGGWGVGGMYDAEISFNFTSNSCQVALVLTIPLSKLY